MKLSKTPLADLVLVEWPVHRDERGCFQRLHCREQLADAGLPCDFPQSNLATNTDKGILRGMHFQRAPHAEDKLVRCVTGLILDVVIDMRPVSPTFGQHYSVELSAANALALFVPKGFAHGYMTLTKGAAVLYHVTTPFVPGAEGGIRWNDPAFCIAWPTDRPVLSAKDSVWPDFDMGRAA